VIRWHSQIAEKQESPPAAGLSTAFSINGTHASQTIEPALDHALQLNAHRYFKIDASMLEKQSRRPAIPRPARNHRFGSPTQRLASATLTSTSERRWLYFDR
jgi:hypothetical protein